MASEVEINVDVGEPVEADRDIQQLSEKNNRLSGIFFIVAAVVGVGFLLLSLLFGGGDDVEEELEQRVRNRVPVNEPIRLPDPVPAPAAAASEEQDERRFQLAALEMERLRQQQLARERAREAAALTAEEEAELERQKRQSSMVVMDGGQATSMEDDEPDDPQDRFIRQMQELQEMQEASLASVSGFGAGVGGAAEEARPENQIFTDPNERFLRDAGDADVVEVSAARLENQDFLITQGTMVSGVLETAINSDLPGMTRALVDKPIYARTGAQVLIPRGSRLIGRYTSGIETGQSRIYIVWTRLERPDGVVIELGSPGTDALGRAGLTGDVDRHFFERFGAAALLSAIGPSIAVLSDGADQTQAQRDIIRDGQQDTENAVEAILEDSLNIPPTITVDQGTEIAIFVNRDLSFAQAMGVR